MGIIIKTKEKHASHTDTIISSKVHALNVFKRRHNTLSLCHGFFFLVFVGFVLTEATMLSILGPLSGSGCSQ